MQQRFPCLLQNNKASSLTNFFRNWGGSFGIAFVTTLAERRQNFHSGLRVAMGQTAAYLCVHGFSQADAVKAATVRSYEQLTAETRLLGFMDCFYLIELITLALAPLALLTKSFKNAGKSPTAH